MEKDNLSSLYNALISKGYSTDDLGDENTFRSKMSDKNNRKDLYDYVSGRGDFRIGDYDSYENRLAGDMEGNTSKAGPKAQEVVDEFDSFRRANAQNEEGNREQPIQRPTLKDMVNPQNEPLWMKRGNAVPSKDGLLSNEDLENRLEIAFKSGALEPLRHRDEDASIDKEYTPKVEEKEEDVFENYRNRFGLTQRGTELQEELAQIQSDLQDKYFKEFENTPEYKAIVGKKYNTKEEIDAANKALNDAYNKKYGAVINKEMEPYLKAYESEIFQRYAPRIQEGLRTVAKNDTSKEVKKLTGEVDDLLEKQHKILRSKGPSSGNAMSALMGSTTYNQSTAKERQELGALEASQRLLEQSQEIIEEAGKKGNTNFFAGLGRGFRDNMDIENFTFGLSEMADSKYLNRALEKAEKGEKLTPAEEKLLEASVVNMATYGYFSSDLGRGYGAGSTTAVSLPFMLEFIANPISGSGNAIAKGLLKFGLKKFGRASAQAAGKGTLNALGRGITSNAGKLAGRLVGDATAALGMEGTTGLGRVAAGTLDRLNENYDYSLDDNGKLQVQKTGDTSIGGAFARSAASKFFENQSEMVFNAFRGWSPFMKAVDRALPGRVGEFMNRIKNSKPGQLYRELKNNPTFKEIVERAQFHGQGEEYLEEVYNNLANVAMGEMTMEDALDLDNNIDTFLGLAPTSVMFGLLGLGSMAADRYSNRRKMRTAFGKMTPEQQAKLTELTQMSKERGNEDIKNFIEATIADTDLTPEQKRDEIEYAFELAKQNAIEDLQQEQTPEERAADDAYIQGTEMPVEQRYSANQERVAAEESLREVDEKALDTIDRLLADDASINEVNEVLSGMEEQTATLARDYYNKSVRMNGVVDSARDDAQETGDVFEANLEKAVVTDELGNRTVTTATLMSGVGEEKVQVKVLDNDGTKAVVLMDNGSKKMVSSNSLSNVQTMLADDIVNAYKEKIETQAKEQTAFTIQNHPKTQIPQPGMQLWNGDIPFIITEVNADGSVRAFPAVLDSKTGQMELKNGSTPVDMSVKESLDLQNDYYDKMDAAINGVNLSEKQAQNAISPSDGESKVLAEVATQPIAGKTEESGRYSTESVQPSQDVEQTSPIVMKEDGTPDFVATGKVNSLSYLNDKYKEKTLRKIEVTKDAYAKDLEKVSVALEKAQTAFDDAPIGREAKAEEALQKAKQAYDNVKRESDFWTSLYEIAKIDAEQPGDKIAEEIRAMGEPMDGRELAAEMLALGRLPLLYSDYKRETGFGENEAKGLFGLFKSKDNGGLSIKKAGEILMLADQEAGSNFFDPNDANAGRNAILDVLSSVRTRGGLIDYVKNNRDAMAERERIAEQEYEEEQREAWAQENFGMSYADYITYEEVIYDIIQEKALSKEAIQEFYNNFAEELNNWNNGRITEETTINERGSVDSGSESSKGLLSTEQLSDNRGIETDISAEADGRADNKSIPASEESIITEIKDAREQVDTNPSDAQKKAGNYKKGHIKLDGYDITIENPQGSERSGTDRDGNSWRIIMNNDYGYIRGTESVDGDHIDVFLSDNPVDGKVYVIDQINEDGSFDEHKVMYGFNSTDEARDAYLSNYSSGWKGLGAISEVSKDEFKKWIDSSQRKTKPFVEYKNVKRESTQSENQGNITSKSTSPQKNSGDIAENLPQSKSAAKNKKRAADIKRARYELMDAKRELSVAQSTNSGYTPAEVEEKKKRVEEAENELKKLTNTKNAFLGESDFILKRVDEAFQRRKDKSMSKEEWEYTDEAITAENEASDSYSSYIKDLANSGELQKMYDNSSVGERIQIREGIETAGLEVNDLIDTSKEKEEAKKKRDAKKKKQSEELMKKLGIYDKGVRFREIKDDDIISFAQKYNLKEDDVRKYVQSMNIGNLGGASYAFKNIKRNIRLLNSDLSLGEFVKTFAPVKKELYKKFGNVDALRDEYVQREMEKRNVMEAARKRAEEVAEAERKRLEKFELMTDEEMDVSYFNALEENDESRMRDIVNEAARRKGYVSADEFRMAHRAPSYDEEGYDKSLVDVAKDKDNIRQSLNEQLKMNRDTYRDESASAINEALSAIDKGKHPTVTIYRAVPKSLKEGKVRNGDWVSLSESYVKIHGEHALNGNYKIMKEEVPAENVYWDGNDINEWGYDDRSDYRYKDTKNNRKLTDLITRDDNGNVIPPSKRFNARKADTRYRLMGEQGAANLDKAEEATTRMDNLNVAREMEAAFNAKKERIEKLRKSEPVEITGKEVIPSNDLKQYKKNALSVGKSLQGEYINSDTGNVIQLQRGRKNGGVNEILQHDYKDEEHLQSIAAIPQIIEKSIYIASEDNTDIEKNPNVSEYQYYVCGLKIGDVDYTVRATVAVDKDGNRYYDHKLTHIEKGTLVDNLNGLSNSVAANQSSSFMGGFGTTPGTKPTTANLSYVKDKKLLSILQTNEKENAKKIKMATGWERGADGKWRYEVEDFEVDPEGLARKNMLWSNLSWGKEYDMLSDKLLDGVELTEEESSRFDELAEKANDLRKSYQANDKRYLDDYIKDDRLFKAYPELKQIRVELYNAPTSNTGATYYENQNLIRVNESALNHEDFRSILAHEVQHAVQAIEGFARGGNRMTYRRYLDALKEKRDVWSMLEEFDRKREELGKDASQIDVYNALRDEYLSDGFNFGDGFIPSRTAFDNGFNLWVRGYDKEGYEDSYNEYQYLINKFGLGFDNDRYKELSGEVESRNVQSRMNMTPEERRNTLASETEDVSREDQIFLNDAFSSTSLSALLMKEDNNQEQIIQSVEDLSGKLNTPVRIARSLDEISDESAKHAIEEGRKVKGWFYNGEVVIYLPNAESVDDAKATVLHEVVGHRGLRNLFGTKNESEFNAIMMDLFEKLPLDVRSEIADIAIRRYASNVSIAMDEYLAEQAEKDETPGWWDRVVSAIRDFFRKMGVDVQLSENDVKYLLWRSRKKLESGDLFEHARDVVMRNKLGIDSDETQKASESVPKEGTRFREVENEESPLNKEMLSAWDELAASTAFQLKETGVDYLTAVDKFTKLIADKTNSRVLDYENAYYALLALSSKNREEMNWYDSFIAKPLNTAIYNLVGKDKVGKRLDWDKDVLRDLVVYVESKHGIERNRQVAVEKFINGYSFSSFKEIEQLGVPFDRDAYNRELKSIKDKAYKEAYDKAYDEYLNKYINEGIEVKDASEKADKSAKNKADKAQSKASDLFRDKVKSDLTDKARELMANRWEEDKRNILNNTELTWLEKQTELDKAATLLGADLSKDYSGLSSVFKDSGDWKQASYDYVLSYEGAHDKTDLENLWRSVRNATNYALKKQLNTGLVSKEYVERQLNRFENYIPLRGFNDEIAGDVYSYLNNDVFAQGSPVKSIKDGRKSEAGNPFGSILQIGYSSIAIGNKNIAKQRFYNFVSNHDTGGLAVVNNVWMIDYETLKAHPELKQISVEEGEEVPEMVEAVPNIPANATAEQVTSILSSFEETMKELEKEGKAQTVKGKSKIAYRTLHGERSEHEIPLFIGGNRYMITITGNPRVAQAINGLTNPDSYKGAFEEINKRMKQFMAGSFTSFNLPFAFANLSKDTMYANNQAFIRENTKWWWKFTKNQASYANPVNVAIMLMKHQRGTLDTNNESERYFKEFMENGGATGYTFVETQKEYADKIEKILKELASGKKKFPEKLVKDYLFGSIEFLGQAAEVTNRYAAFRTSRELGRSISRSINDAKDITVNFNRKGAGRKTANANNKTIVNLAAWSSEYGIRYILFWNAAMQSKYMLYKNLKEHPIKTSTTLIAGNMALGATIPFLNNMLLPVLFEFFGWGSDDDKEDYYDVLTDYERQHNIMIRLPKGYWFKFPLSPEFVPFYAIGDMITGSLSGKRKLDPMDIVKSAIDAASPLNIQWEYTGGKFLLNFLPTVSQPIIQNIANVNFMGSPLAKTPINREAKNDPEFKNVFKNESPALIELSRLTNSLTEGNDVVRGAVSWNPAYVRNLITGYSGGWGGTFLSIADWMVGTANGEKQTVLASQTPFVSRFLSSGNKDVKLKRINSNYQDVVKFYSKIKHDERGYEKKIDETKDNFEQAEYQVKLNKLLDSKEYGRYQDLENIVKAIEKMEKLQKADPDNEQLRDDLYKLKLGAIEIYHEEKK